MSILQANRVCDFNKFKVILIFLDGGEIVLSHVIWFV